MKPVPGRARQARPYALAPAGPLLALCLVVAGCGERKVATDYGLPLSKPLEGHVYLAQLMSAHPLYPAGKRLSAEIDREQREQVSERGFGPGAAWLTPLLVGPAPPGFPEQAFRRDWLAWEAQFVPPEEPEPTGLPPDLEAEKRWRHRQIDLEEAQALARVYAEESRRLAAVREELVRARLEELTNAGLGLGLPPGEARQQAEETRRRIWAEIEQGVSQEQQASQARIAQQAERLDGQSRRLKAQVEVELEAEARARRESQLPALVAPREEMLRRMKQFAEGPGAAGPRREVAGAGPSPADLQEAEQARNRALAAFREARQRQLQRLEESKAELVRAILADVRLGVLRVAFEDNLRITLVPPGTPRDVDLTDQVRARLETIWSGRTE